MSKRYTVRRLKIGQSAQMDTLGARRVSCIRVSSPRTGGPCATKDCG